MEQNENCKWEFSKLSNGYRGDECDFIIPHELSITVTLHEYRELVTYKAKYDYTVETLKAEWNKKLETKDKEIECLKNQIKAMVSTDEDDEE